jgi:rfaE bifunctional protein kinase chain/domain
MLRVDREQVRALGAGSLAAVRDLLAKLVPGHKVVVVSDYGKGLVGKALMEELHQAVARCDPRPKILVDPKVVNASVYQGVDLLTPNAKEAGEMAGVKASGRDGVIKAGLGIFRRLRCAQLCVTLGAEGLALFENPGRVLHVPTVARKVFDVTGAGDTVIAALALGLAADLSLIQAGMLANYAAGLVVAQVGTAVARPKELVAAMRAGPGPVVENWLNIS